MLGSFVRMFFRHFWSGMIRDRNFDRIVHLSSESTGNLFLRCAREPCSKKLLSESELCSKTFVRKWILFEKLLPKVNFLRKTFVRKWILFVWFCSNIFMPKVTLIANTQNSAIKLLRKCVRIYFVRKWSKRRICDFNTAMHFLYLPSLSLINPRHPFFNRELISLLEQSFQPAPRDPLTWPPGGLWCWDLQVSGVGRAHLRSILQRHSDLTMRTVENMRKKQKAGYFTRVKYVPL
jgi:hypothetical protein